MEVTAFMFNQNLSSILPIVKPFTRKLASDNLASPSFSLLLFCNKESRKQNHKLHNNESMRNDETKMLEKTFFKVEPCQRNEGQGIMLRLERFIRQILDLLMAEGHLAE